MFELDSQNDKYGVTARIFNFINELSLEKQFILYKQLVKGKVTTELLKLIIDMSEDEKFQLLEQLGEMHYEDESIRTVNLDDDESFMRENPRKICLIAVKCKVEDRSFKSYIIDISAVGAFIESNDRFPVGQKIVMAFKLPNHHEAFQLKGRIARSGSKGIGVRFYDLTPTQEDVIRKFIEIRN
ncbi:MAG: PilZ domain-containing protein [Desulfobacterales bacterium]|nr:MAG: PilZ domain-containing protein [Desulfobacterales bacterium]